MGTTCHCEEDGRTTRQAIVSRGTRTTCLFAYWFTVDRHGLSALAMTRCGGMQWAVRLHHPLCHYEERAERGTRQSIVVSRVASGDGARVLAHTDLQGTTKTLVIQINASANRE